MPNLSCLLSRSCATALALAVVLGGQAALAQGTLRIGMTAADVPLTTGQTDQGGEGMRFMGYTVYDGLINWDLSSADKPSVLVARPRHELEGRRGATPRAGCSRCAAT